MASNPQFYEEDETDEDFFNNLVEDSIEVTQSHMGLEDVLESDEDEAVGNPSIGNVGVVLEGSGIAGLSFEGEVRSESRMEPTSLVSTGSNVFDSVAELGDLVTALDLTMSNCSEFRGSEGKMRSETEIEGSLDVPEKDISAPEVGTALVSTGSFAFDTATELGDLVSMTTDVAFDSIMANDSGSRGSEGEVRSESMIELSPDVPEKGISAQEEGSSPTSSGSSAFDMGAELGDSVSVTRNVVLDSTVAKSGRSRGMSVKEVEWTMFDTDSAQIEAGKSASYSDFFNELADSLIDPFAEVGDKLNDDSNSRASFVGNSNTKVMTSFTLSEHQHNQYHGTVGEQTQDGLDLYSSQYWENLYPGWRYDPVSGKWYQLDSHNVAETLQVGYRDNSQLAEADVLHQRSEVSYLQHSKQSVVRTVVEDCTMINESNWNQASQGSAEYPSNMVFDPQYPGWYYDTVAQEWRLLESYAQAEVVQTQTSTGHDLSTQDGNVSLGSLSKNEHGLCKEFNQSEHCKSQDQCGMAMSFTKNQQTGSLHSSVGQLDNSADQQMDFKTMETDSVRGQVGHSYDNYSGDTGSQSFASADNLYQYNRQEAKQSQQTHVSPNYYGNQTSAKYAQHPFHAGNTSSIHFSCVQTEARSSAGRPPHALVTFGFGGKLVVLKDNSSSYGNQGAGTLISILNLMEVVVNKTRTASLDAGACEYFHALCEQSFPGPLVGGSVTTKELYKWIDERVANCQSSNMDFRKGEVLRLLLSLLKICCQHYGKLRSPFGVDSALQDADTPELAVTKLFASAGCDGAQLSKHGAITYCMQNLPTEGKIQMTAVEVQNLLVSGRRKEALQCAQEGQLWGPALVLAAQLGEKFYVDTVKQMAHRQFVSGSPLRALYLLIAGQPVDVFSRDSSQSASVFSPFLANGLLDDWEENLAIITANRTKDDELVITNLGDCLWKERGQITAAHVCYLVAEANFESYSNCARLCLFGADHWKCPRTYASPEAIQRTELYEYSKGLGNSQFILLPFQPYKVIYAHMLAEVGKVADSLRYCQATLKTLKNCGLSPEVEKWKSLLSSLGERIKTHQQSGYSTNLDPSKLVGKLFNSIDRSIHRMVGSPSPVPSTYQSGAVSSYHENHSKAIEVATSQSTMAMSSLMPSVSPEPTSEFTGDNNIMTTPNRSISEPDFSQSPKQDQVSPSKREIPTGGKSSIAGGPSRFGLFGSQLLQKTIGWVSRSRPVRQAKLGEKNKFYYDEKLKRWVEEGAEPPAEEAALPPPPTTTSFQNGMSDYKSTLNSQSLPSNGGPEAKSQNSSEPSLGLPPIPPSKNQFSACGRMGVQSRYVDTFNKGAGTATSSFQSPSIPPSKAAGSVKFFVPTPMASVDQREDATGESIQEVATSKEPSMTAKNASSFSSMPSSAPSMQRSLSTNNINLIANKGMEPENGSGSAPSHTKAASWSGSYTDLLSTKPSDIKPFGEALGLDL